MLIKMTDIIRKVDNDCGELLMTTLKTICCDHFVCLRELLKHFRKASKFFQIEKNLLENIAHILRAMIESLTGFLTKGVFNVLDKIANNLIKEEVLPNRRIFSQLQ